VEKLVVKFVGFFQVFLLHAVAYPAMFAIRLCGVMADESQIAMRSSLFVVDSNSPAFGNRS
jgi:hypothetical protein